MDAAMDISWVPPDQNRRGRNASMSVEAARAAALIVNESVLELPEELTFHGELIGLNLRLKTFEISEHDSGRRISGKIAQMSPQVENARMKRTYFARINKIVEIHPATGAQSIHWVLIDLISETPE